MILVSMRPRQWTKNLLVFAPLLFAKHLFALTDFVKASFAFLLWCLISGGVYIINDVVDMETDHLSPRTAKRPIANGDLPPGEALLSAAALILFSFAGCIFLNAAFVCVMAGYLLLTLSYTFYLRRVVILDILIVAVGFVLRAIGGGVAINVEVSSWLLLCTLLLALFIVICKRRFELTQLGGGGGEFRGSLKEYSLNFIDQMVAIVTSTTLVAYSFYTISGVTVQKFHTDNLKYTIPFALYGIFRYLFIVYHLKSGGSPEIILIKDRPFQLNLLFWLIAVVLILYHY